MLPLFEWLLTNLKQLQSSYLAPSQWTPEHLPGYLQEDDDQDDDDDEDSPTNPANPGHFDTTKLKDHYDYSFL